VLDHTIHGIGQVTHVYAKYDFLEEKREALDLWSRHLVTLLAPKSKCAELAARPGSRRRRRPPQDGVTPVWHQTSLLEPKK
jgi:hypothetical protein